MPLFYPLSLIPPDLHNSELDGIIEPVATRVVCPPKHILAMPGENLDFLWYVQSGCAKLFMDNGEGVTKMLYTLKAGWFYGETPCFMHVTTGLFFQTETRTVLYKIPEAQCRRLMEESALFRDSVVVCMANKLLMLRHEVANLTFNSCKERIRRLFCSATDVSAQADSGWYALHTHYTHSEVGEIVGAARVTVSRQISELCNEGFLRVINRRIQVNTVKYKAYSFRHVSGDAIHTPS